MVLDVFVFKIYKYIGLYVVRMYGVDVIVFIVGIGENLVEICVKVFEGLEFMGVYWDFKKNENLLCGKEGFINYFYLLVKVVVILIDEESMIVCDVMIFGGLK